MDVDCRKIRIKMNGRTRWRTILRERIQPARLGPNCLFAVICNKWIKFKKDENQTTILYHARKTKIEKKNYTDKSNSN